MKVEVKEKWLAALRSGEYKQGTGCLRRENEYCCLGVLCDLHAKETNGKWERPNRYSYLGATGLLPGEVCNWANGGPFMNPSEYSLVDLNDHGKSFKEIADFIEEKL